MSMKLFFVLCLSLFSASLSAQTNDLLDDHLVSLAQVKSEQVKPVMWLPGNVVSRNSATISAQQSGQLLWVADIGDKFNKGDVIARIDDQPLVLQLAQLKAELEQTGASVAFLQKQKQRMQTLANNMSTSLSELDRTERDLSIEQSQLAVLKLRIQQTQLAHDNTQVLAPFDGEISERFAQMGELVDNRTPLLQLTDIHALDIQVSAPLDIAGFIQPDSIVLVKWRDHMVSLPIRTFTSAGDRTSRTFDVRLDASNVKLFPGSAVTVSLPRSREDIATLVPRDALILREDEISVLKVVDNIVEKIGVKVGLGMGDWVSVVGNLAALDQVVIRGGEGLSAGQKVRVN